MNKSRMKSGGKRNDLFPAAKINGSGQIRRDLGLGFLILFIVFMAYLPAVKADFIWDDDTFLTENKLIKAPDGLWRFWFSTDPPDYFPLTSTTLFIEWRLWGMNASGYHVVNILLHCISAVLLWLVLRDLKIPGSWLAALLFGLHPVCVESVAWITERKNTLPMTFYLLSLLLFLKSEKTWNIRLFMLSLFSFLLALLSKTSVVMLPIVLILCLWWLNRKVSLKDLIKTVPYFALSVILSLVTIWFQYNRAIESDVVRSDGFASRLAVAGCAVWFYIYKAIFPVNLSFVYPRWAIDPFSILSYIPLVLIFVCSAVLFIRRNSWARPFLFSLGYYLATLIPVLGFLNIYFMKYSLVADHWQYTALPGLVCLAVGIPVYYYSRAGRKMKRIAELAAVLAAGAFFCLSFRQSLIYRSPETLWKDTLKKNPSSFLADNSLGLILFTQGKIEESLALYRQSIKLKPDDDVAYNGMGAALLKQGKAEDAIKYFQKAVELNPDYDVTLCNLGNTLSHLGRKEEANHYFLKAVVADPNSFAAHYFLGNNYMDLGQNQKALKHYLTAVRLNPDFAKPHQKLGEIYYSLGRYDKSIDHYRRAVKIQPQWLDLKSNLAWILSSVEDEKFRNGEEAVRLAEEICQKDGGKNPIYLDILAAAYATAGHYSEATKTAQKALRIAESKGAQNIAGIIKKHIEAFQQGRPWTQKPQP